LSQFFSKFFALKIAVGGHEQYFSRLKLHLVQSSCKNDKRHDQFSSFPCVVHGAARFGEWHCLPVCFVMISSGGNQPVRHLIIEQ
jgi:hypothetical protein